MTIYKRLQQQDEKLNPILRFSISLIRPSLLYFLVVFSAGFLLGSFRVLMLVDRLGERNAELVEMPLMAMVCALSAHYIIKRYATYLNVGGAAMVGMLALVLLLGVELAVVLEIRGFTLAEYLESRDAIAGSAYLVGLAWFAIAPMVFWVLRRQRSEKEH